MKPVRIVDFETSFEAAHVITQNGEVIWAEVRIVYTSSGVEPSVTIRVPVPWEANQTAGQRKAAALRAARELIDHACRASGLQLDKSEESIGEIVEDVLPSALAGLTQELGLTPPAAKPRKKSPV
jgi:nucleotide-binding universal stress UspA family protein